MADATLKRKVYEALKTSYFTDPDDSVDVSDGDAENIHVVVVSRKFEGRRLSEKIDLIWSVLTQNLDETACEKVTLAVGATPSDVKAGV